MSHLVEHEEIVAGGRVFGQELRGLLSSQCLANLEHLCVEQKSGLHFVSTHLLPDVQEVSSQFQ